MTALSPRQMWRLDEACRPIRQTFHTAPYLVGTALTGRDHRDVDVRLILEDEPYDALADQLGPNGMAFLGIVFGEYLAARTDLPVDFQLQRQTEANEHHQGPRNPLGVRSLADYAGDGNAIVTPSLLLDLGRSPMPKVEPPHGTIVVGDGCSERIIINQTSITRS